MVPAKMEVVWPKGLDLRTGGLVVILASHFESTIWLRVNDQIARATDVLELMRLKAGAGTQVEAWAEGPDGDSAMQALARLFACKCLDQTESVDAVTLVRELAKGG